MLSALGDLIFGLLEALVDLTLWLGDLAARPLRFLFSPQYRQQVRRGWSSHPVRALLEFIGGSVVLVLLLGTILFWTLLVMVGATQPSPSEQKEQNQLKQRIIEKLKHPKKEEPKH